MPSSRLGCPLSLKTPNMGNTGNKRVPESTTLKYTNSNRLRRGYSIPARCAGDIRVKVIVHRNDNVDITLAIPIESDPTTEDSVSVQTLANVQTLESSFDGLNRHGKLRYSWAVDLKAAG